MAEPLNPTAETKGPAGKNSPPKGGKGEAGMKWPGELA